MLCTSAVDVITKRVLLFTVAAQQELILIGIHVKPDAAVEENNALMDVHSAVEQKWGTDNILIMGDLNADCSYVPNLPGLAFRTDPRFLWLIGDDVDTTTKSTDCAYDRCVKSIKSMKATVNRSVRPITG